MYDWQLRPLCLYDKRHVADRTFKRMFAARPPYRPPPCPPPFCIGAKEEGILRYHMVMRDGRYRDSVCFSIIESEWPAVKAALQAKLEKQY